MNKIPGTFWAHSPEYIRKALVSFRNRGRGENNVFLDIYSHLADEHVDKAVERLELQFYLYKNSEKEREK